MFRSLWASTQLYLKELYRFDCETFDISPFWCQFGAYWCIVARYVGPLAEGSETSKHLRGG